MNWAVVLIVVQLIFLEGILSIDNAAVLGAMVAHLPEGAPIVWPDSLRPLGNALQPFLGSQRQAALRVGLLGAYLGRGLMLALASFVAHNHGLKILGAVYLIRLACNHLGQPTPGQADTHTRSTEALAFWSVVLTVELTDLAFSLDNVVVAVALSDQLWVVMVGVALGIGLMRFAAGLFSYAVQREPVLKTAAYVLVLNIGAELLLEDLRLVHFPDGVRFLISVATLSLALAYAHFEPLQIFKPALIWLGRGCAIFNKVFDLALAPLAWLGQLLWRGVRLIF